MTVETIWRTLIELSTGHFNIVYGLADFQVFDTGRRRRRIVIVPARPPIDGNLPVRGLVILLPDVAAIGALAVVITSLYLLLPKQGDIWWMDASRHALNGALILDFVRQLPLHDPMSFAYDYYLRYPALTIGFYPPLFSVVLAGFYAVFGVSETTALLCELVFLFALGCGAYRLSRHWLAPVPALSVALLLMGSPELLFWGQQVMLDIPAYAFLIWAGDFFINYLRTNRRHWLYLAVLMTAASVYTKYNAVFFVVPIGFSLIYMRGRRAFIDPDVVRAILLGAVALLPVIVWFFIFARYNLQQSVATPAGAASGHGLTYYAAVLPSVLSYPTVMLACIYAILLPFMPALRLSRSEAVFLSAWLLVGYVFYSAVAIKEARHILFITYPLVLSAILLLDRLMPRSGWRRLAPVALALAVFGSSLILRPAPYVSGFREVVESVARLAPPDTNVAFWGRLDGTFVYAMRAYANRPDLGVIRLDKLLFHDAAVFLQPAIEANRLTPSQLTDELTDLHSQYVIVQTGYLDDNPAVSALQTAVHTDKFAEVQRIPMASNYPFSNVTELVIYRLAAEVPHSRVTPSVQIKLLGKSL